jgi:hypothetical protein
MKLKIDGRLAANAASGLEPHAGPLYASPGSRRWAVVELKHAERTEPAPDEDSDASVKVRITHLEVANAEQEETLRRVHRALHLHRTAYGTLTEQGEVELADSTLDLAAGELSAIEAARLHVAIDRWVDYGRRVLAGSKATATDLRRELDTVLKGLATAAGQSSLS